MSADQQPPTGTRQRLKFRTPYVPHFYKKDAEERLRSRLGWLTAGVASSIAWPPDDVLVVYDGTEFYLRGCMVDGKQEPPCISTPCPRNDHKDALAKILRFVSVLGWFKGGYVDVSGFVHGSHPIRYGHPRNTFTTLQQGDFHGFDCNYLPIIEDENIRKALAFWREGRRLLHVHEAYSFLSFFKVLESQFKPKERVAWVEANLGLLEDRAGKRVAELRAQGVDVNKHIFDSGRCAVAHASLDGEIVDPDEPADRERIGLDLDIIEALAQRYLEVEVGVPTDMTVYKNRDRLEPWYPLMKPEGLAKLQSGQAIEDAADCGALDGALVTVRVLPHDTAEQFVNMRLQAFESMPGVVKFLAVSARQNVVVALAADFNEGRMHVLVEECSLPEDEQNPLSESDVAELTRFIHRVIGNGRVTLTIDGVDPVDCEVIIPVNIMVTGSPEDAVKQAVAQFRKAKGLPLEGE